MGYSIRYIPFNLSFHLASSAILQKDAARGNHPGGCSRIQALSGSLFRCSTTTCHISEAAIHNIQASHTSLNIQELYRYAIHLIGEMPLWRVAPPVLRLLRGHPPTKRNRNPG